MATLKLTALAGECRQRSKEANQQIYDMAGGESQADSVRNMNEELLHAFPCDDHYMVVRELGPDHHVYTSHQLYGDQLSARNTAFFKTNHTPFEFPIPELISDSTQLFEQAQKIEINLGDLGFRLEKKENFEVNTKTDVHFVIDVDRAEGEKMMADLALRADTEEAWIYIEFELYGKSYRFFTEVGLGESAGEVRGWSSSVLAVLLRNKDIHVKDVSHYHIHPFEGLERRLALRQVLSPEDFSQGFYIEKLMRDNGYRGRMDRRVISAVGTYVTRSRMPIDDIQSVDTAAEKYRQGFTDFSHQQPHVFEGDALSFLTATGLVETEHRYHYQNFQSLIDSFRKMDQTYRDFIKKYPKEKRTVKALSTIYTKQLAAWREFHKAILGAQKEGVPEKVLSFFQEKSASMKHTVLDDLERRLQK